MKDIWDQMTSTPNPGELQPGSATKTERENGWGPYSSPSEAREFFKDLGKCKPTHEVSK